MDELSPLFQDIEFHERFRGYDPDEVDAYVDRVAKGAALVQGRLAELQERAEAAEARTLLAATTSETEATLTRTLILAQRTADAAVAEAKEEAAYIVVGAESEAQATLRTAQAEATAATREAEEHASRIMAETETDKRRILADAEAVGAAVAASERDRLASEVAELEQHRGFLEDDIEILESHLHEQRNVLAASISTLTDLVDQPQIFRAAPAPATSGVEFGSELLETVTTDTEPPSTEVEPASIEVEPASIEVEPASIEVEPVSIEAEIVAEEVEPESADESEVAASESDEESAAGEPDLNVVEEPASSAPVSAWDEPVFAPPPDPLIDLTDVPAADPVEVDPEQITSTESGSNDDVPMLKVIDLDVPEPSASAQPVAVSELAPVPPLLLTAADMGDAEVAAVVPADSDGGPVTAPIPVIDEASLFGEPERHSEPPESVDHGDPFLDQLRDAVAGDEVVELGDDALSAFFDQDDDEAGKSWFGKRR